MTPAEWLTARLAGAWRGGFGTARCPAHEDRSPSLSVRDGDDAPLLKCHAGCSSAAVVDALRRQGLWPVPGGEAERGRPAPAACDRRDWARRIWREARPIGDTIAERYLRGRAIAGALPPTLRYHPSLKHKGTGLHLPAMVAAIQGPDRGVIAVQRTYLKADGSGKAAVSDAKMTLGGMDRGAARLGPAGERLGVAEGVETGLSAAQMFGLAVWCSLGAERLGRLELPPEVRHVVIFGDVGSEAAAFKARDEYRRQGRDAEVRFPSIGKDFNDELRAARAA